MKRKQRLTDVAAWEEIAMAYPEWAAALRDKLDQALRSQRTPWLDKMRPNWRYAVSQKKFKLWLKRQPKALQKLAASERQRDALKLLDAYAKATGWRWLTDDEIAFEIAFE